MSKSRSDGIKIGGNDLPRRITTLAKRKMLIVMMVLMLITMTIMTLILTMAMMVMKCIEEYEIGKNDLPHRMTTLAKRRILISMLVMMMMIMRLTTMTATTMMVTMITMKVMMMMKWKAGVGPPYAKQLSLSVSAATHNLKLEGSC